MDIQAIIKQKNVRRVGRIDHDLVVFADSPVQGVDTVLPVSTMACQHTIVWDRVDAFIANRLGALRPDFIGVFHAASDETREVEVGFKTHGHFEDDPVKALAGARVYDEVLALPEGIYVIGIAREDAGLLQECERRLGDLPGGLSWAIQYMAVRTVQTSGGPLFQQKDAEGEWHPIPSDLTPLPSSRRESHPVGAVASDTDPASTG
jgi:hypothetical protein